METTMNVSRHTVGHFRLRMNSQWSTLEDGMPMDTTVTCARIQWTTVGSR